MRLTLEGVYVVGSSGGSRSTGGRPVGISYTIDARGANMVMRDMEPGEDAITSDPPDEAANRCLQFRQYPE